MPKKVKKTAKKTKAVKPAPRAKTEADGIRTHLVGTDGKAKGTIALPKELFGATVNKSLLAQSVRVYLANQRSGNAQTKTRGEVEGSTRKIYRQKGTGRARHGAIRAPIFVGGGIVFGPRKREYSLRMPEKMQRRALAAALTSQYHDGNIVVVDGIEALPPKTKQFAAMREAVGAGSWALLVLGSGNATQMIRGARNLAELEIIPARNLHPYIVLRARKLILMKDAIKVLKETFVK